MAGEESEYTMISDEEAELSSEETPDINSQE